MSTDTQSTHVESFRQQLREEYAPWTKSRQALDAVKPPDERSWHDEQRHNDGEVLHKHFGMAPFYKVLNRLSNRQRRTLADFPQAFVHLVSHLSKWEKRELKADDPDFSEMTQYRRGLLEWYAADSTRTRRMKPGGTELLAHGEQGTTKTTLLAYLAILVMQLNNDNVIWGASFDDTEWLPFAPYATVALPADVDVQVDADPYTSEFRGQSETVPLDIRDICRDVIVYDDPTDLLEQMSDRTPGQFYAVYPDPSFRGCESITGWRYHSIYDVDELTDATDLWQWWFAIIKESVRSSAHPHWLTFVLDEIHKVMHQKASKDEHDWWQKVSQFADVWGDARKARKSIFGGCHKWHEPHALAKDKIRWGATMNGEKFPSAAPISGSLSQLDLGQAVLWNNQNWTPGGIEYPDLKAVYSVPADISVTFPRWEEVCNAKSR